MTRQRTILDPRMNRLLNRLEREDYVALMTGATIVPLKLGKRLFREGEAVKAVYFPLSAMVSLLVTTTGHTDMEIATVGREGVVGAAALMQEQPPMAMSQIQLPGAAVRIEAAAFLKAIESRPPAAKLMQRYLYALTLQIIQGAVCNRLHGMEDRCARWLLMTHDRAGQDTFPITQEFLSRVLGVRRATVNLATGMLKKAGFIRYLRGMMTIVDRPGLELASCECYQRMVTAYNSLFPEAYNTANSMRFQG